MEARRAASEVAMDTRVRSVRSASIGDVTDKVTIPAEKRGGKMTAKGLANKYDRLQAGRKARLNMAAKIRDSIQGFMKTNEKTKVQNALTELVQVCNEAKGMHDNMLGFMPCDEKEKQVIWFKAKMLSNNDCIANANLWVSQNKTSLLVSGH